MEMVWEVGYKSAFAHFFQLSWYRTNKRMYVRNWVAIV